MPLDILNSYVGEGRREKRGGGKGKTREREGGERGGEGKVSKGEEEN